MSAALGRHFALPVGACPREEVGQAVALEEVAEAVPDGDLGDLGESPDVAGGRAGHGISLTRARCAECRPAARGADRLRPPRRPGARAAPTPPQPTPPPPRS